MEYTQWLLSEYPKLKTVSSAETFAFIKQAKERTRYLSMVSHLLLLIVTFGLVSKIAMSFDILLIESPEGIAVLLFCYVLVEGLSKALDSWLMKRKLREIVEDA